MTNKYPFSGDQAISLENRLRKTDCDCRNETLVTKGTYKLYSTIPGKMEVFVLRVCQKCGLFELYEYEKAIQLVSD